MTITITFWHNQQMVASIESPVVPRIGEAIRLYGDPQRILRVEDVIYGLHETSGEWELQEVVDIILR